MLRIHTIANSAACKKYYSLTDYMMEVAGEWIGNGAQELGLAGAARKEDFERLCDNLHPLTGDPLTVVTRDDRRVGWDFNFNSTKSVGLALELTGDRRIIEAHKNAVRTAMGHIEQDMATRVRVGGKNEDRQTGNLVAMQVVHRTTRPNKDDQLPDMSLHSHVVVFNATNDPVEDRWKAAQIGQIKHDAPYYEAIYHNRLAANLQKLGYGIRRKDKTFEINGVSDELIQKFSRRTAEIEKMQRFIEEKFGTEMGDEAKSKLGATTRMNKVDIRSEDLTGYWVSRLTDREKTQLKGLIGKPSFRETEADAVRYAVGHLFERQSVVEERKLYETAMRHGMGSVALDGVRAEAKRQGVLVKDRQATTKDVLAEEARIIAFARDGRGAYRPMKRDAAVRASPANASIEPTPGDQPLSTPRSCHPQQPHHATLSPEQQAVCEHVWSSTDRVILIRGAAGTGKTTAMKTAIAGIDRPVVTLAPSAEASRGVLRRDGFANADTVASFLQSPLAQQKARNGVIWVDEAGLLPIRDLDRLCVVAEVQNARIVLQGDPKQHKSVARHGNMFRVLQEFAGLPVAELKDIKRQRGDFKAAVAAIDAGDFLAAHDKLNALGWIKQTPAFDHNKPIVDAYLDALETKKPSQDATERVLLVAPTHAEGDEITAEIRTRLKQKGAIGQDEKFFDTLVPLHWSEEQRRDPLQYTGQEVVQFVRNSGPHRAGDRVEADGFDAAGSRPEHFAVYARSQTAIAVGDIIRITGRVKDREGVQIDNGTFLTVTGFTDTGNIMVQSQRGQHRTILATAGHFTHGYVSTSHSAQGKTVDRVLIAMGHESRPAVNAEQFYVSVSRARERATIYTNMAPAILREAIQRGDSRKSATELMHPRHKPKKRTLRVSLFMEKLRGIAEKAVQHVIDLTKERKNAYER